MNTTNLNILGDRVIVKKQGGSGGGNNKIVYDANSQEDLKALHELIMSMPTINEDGPVIFEDVVVLINYRDSRYVLYSAYQDNSSTISAFYQNDNQIYVGNLVKDGDEYYIARYE